MRPWAPAGPGRSRKLPASLVAGFVCALAFGLASPRPAAGQVFQLTGGSSTLLDAEGGSLEVRTNNYSGRFDLGYLGRPSVGFSLLTNFKGSLLDAGDQQIPFLLPTDLFQRSFSFLGRGMSVSRTVDGGKLFAFAGTTSNGYYAPFFNVSTSYTAAGAIYYEKPISPTLRFYSRNIFSDRQTSIQAIEWAARKDIKMALSGGIGNNQHYAATSFAMDRHWMILDASYALVGDAFRRVLVTTPQLAENDRENIRAEFRPMSNFRLVLNRNNYSTDIPSQGLVRAAVDGVSVGASAGGFQSYGSWFNSATAIGDSSAMAAGTRHRITQRLEAGVDFMRSTYSKGTPAYSTDVNFREIFSSRFSVTQFITHNNGQTAYDFGGNFISNLVTVSVDYQTVFLPFVQNGPGQFKQVMVLGLHFQLPHGVQFNLDSDVTPLGQIRYTAYGTTYAYHGQSGNARGTSFSGAFLKNVVRGEVLDPVGQPIEGAAVQVGSEVAVTDSEGNFMVRTKKAGDVSLKISFGDFTAPGKYAIVQAPATVRATNDDAAQVYTIVLRRLPNGVSSADPSHQPDLLDHPPASK
jgi:hypothetical protein